MKSLFEPWPHQLYTANFAVENELCFDMSDPGVGKTSAHLLAYNERRKQGYSQRLLVVCPKTLMTSAWAAEIERYFPHLTYSIADAKNRIAAFKLKTHIVIMNTDGVKAIVQLKNKKWVTTPDFAPYMSDFTDLIVDESTSFKHATSQRSKSMWRLSKLFTNKALLTGTPNSNSVTELWHPMLILDGGKRLGDNFFAFRNSVQSSEQVGPSTNMVKWHDKPGALEAVFNLIQDVTVRHAFEDVMTHVPANHVARYDFDLNTKLMRQYRLLEQTCVIDLADANVTAVHAAALRTKLLQLASGAVYTEEGKYTVLDTQRYELGCDLIEQYNHSIVFFNWKHQRDQMSAMLTARGIKFAIIDGNVNQASRDQIVIDFQDGLYQTILLHPRTGAHGLTLTRGEACILLSPIYEADLLKQAIHRIYRGAQNKVTNTILVQARNTVEDIVYDRRLAKTTNMNDFLQLVEAAQSRRE